MRASGCCVISASVFLLTSAAAGAEDAAAGRAQRLLDMQAEIQSLVDEGEPLRAQLQELIPRYASGGPEELAGLSAERGRIRIRLQPIHLRLAVLEPQYAAEARAYEVEQGFRALMGMKKGGAVAAPGRVMGDIVALERFNQSHIDFFKRIGALLGDDARAFASAQEAARTHRRTMFLVWGGIAAGALAAAASLLAWRKANA